MSLQDTFLIYFWANSLVFSYYLGADIVDATRDKEKSKYVLEIILLVLVLLSFGSIMTLYDWVKQGLTYLFEKVNTSLQIKFFFQFYFTKKYNSLTDTELKRVDDLLARHQSKSIHDRIWRHCIRLINKRNNK